MTAPRAKGVSKAGAVTRRKVGAAGRAGPRAVAARPARVFTSREAAQASGVPFFTLDYWSRSGFLVPSVAQSRGRGRGRERRYSFGDLLLLAVARELRGQRVSVESLRALVRKLAPRRDELAAANWVLVGREMEVARSAAELTRMLRLPGRRSVGVLLDLRTLRDEVERRVDELDRERRL